MNNCQAGHTTHSHIEVMTDLGPMQVYEWKKYLDFNGFCTGQDDVSRTLDLYGWWDQPIKHLIERLTYGAFSKGTFIDVGAHVGYFSKLAQKYGLKVMAYEAETESLEMLKENVSTAETHQIWFDENTQPAKFDPDLKVDIMKIDIEGAEQHAIRYFEQLFVDKKVENLIMEVSPTFNDSYPVLLRMLESLGLKVCELSGEKFNWDFNFNQTNLWLHL